MDKKNIVQYTSNALEGTSLLKVIKFDDSNRKDNISLLTLSIDEMEKKFSLYFKKNSIYLFVSCLFPLSGGEEILAIISDLLHSQHNEFLDLGRIENISISIGANFYDLNFGLKYLNPNTIILLQNKIVIKRIIIYRA